MQRMILLFGAAQRSHRPDVHRSATFRCWVSGRLRWIKHVLGLEKRGLGN